MNYSKRKPLFDPVKVKQAIAKRIKPGTIFEYRAVDATLDDDRREGIVYGFFDSADALIKELSRVRSAKGQYITANPVDPKLHHRAFNKLKRGKTGDGTGDKDIVRRVWLIVDVDADRPANISATDGEHRAALDLAAKIRAKLSAEGWPEPLYEDSGNGGRLNYALDLPADDGGLVKRCVEALDARYSGNGLSIDTTVHNPARIDKLPGTLCCKGDDTPERPHRMANIIDAPAVVKVVPVELLEALANEATKPTTGHPSGNGQAASGHGSFDLEAWIAEHCPDARLKRTSDGEVWVLPVCAWDASHTGGCAHISRRTNGVIGAACKHNSCAGKGWHELRDAVEPGWRDRRPSRVDAVHGATGDGQGKAFDETDEWPAPLGDEAYHGLVGEFVRAIAPHTESDAVALIAQTLTAVGNVIGRTAFFRAEADRHFGNLDICLVGTTSKARKGSSAGQMKRLVRGVDRAWADEHVLSGLSSGEGLIHAVRDPTFKRVPQRDGKGPKAPIVGYEEVEADAGVKDKRLLVVESEFSSVLKQMLRERNILSAIIRQAWDSGDLRTLTKNSPTKATGAHISIIGHITRDELRRLITETEMANGLANRFLWFCARRSKFLPDGGTANTLDLSEYEWRLREAVQFAKSTGEVRRDDAARELWHAVYADLSGGKPGLLGAITSRAEAQVMRLALVYALLDCSDTIRLEHLTAALAVWEYAEASAAYAFGRALGDATADEILAALRRQAPKGMSRDEIRNHFGRNKPATEIERALGVLFHEQLARCEKMTDTGGRPAEVWFVR